MGKVTVDIQGNYYSLEDRAEIYKIAESLAEVARVEHVRATSGVADQGGTIFNGSLDYRFTINLERDDFPGLGKLVRTIRFGADWRWAVFFEEKDIQFRLPPREHFGTDLHLRVDLMKNWDVQCQLISIVIRDLIAASTGHFKEISDSVLDLYS